MTDSAENLTAHESRVDEFNERAIWWEELSHIDVTDPKVVEALEAYVRLVRSRNQIDRRAVVDRFVLWQQGYSFIQIAEYTGLKLPSVRQGVEAVGHYLMGTERKPVRQQKVASEPLRNESLTLQINSGAVHINLAAFQGDLANFNKNLRQTKAEVIMKEVQTLCDQKTIDVVACYLLLGLRIVDICDVYNLSEELVIDILRTAAATVALGPYDSSSAVGEEEL